MARAFVKWYSQAEYDASSGKDKITIELNFTGADVPSGYDVAYGEILLDPGDPAALVRQALTEVVLFEALARGYVVIKQDMRLPSIQQGV